MSPAVRAAFLPALAFLTLVAGGVLRLLPPGPPVAHLVWTLGLFGLGVPVLVRTARGLVRGRWAADLVAALAILTAMLLGQPLAGLVIVLMQTGGEALEAYAVARASDAVRALEAEAPQTVHRLAAGQTAEPVDVPVAEAHPGDRLLVLPGEMIPCDGEVEQGESSVDVARITGEPVPVSARPGVRLASGSLNQHGPLVLRVLAPAGESLYARIVDLVRTAQESKAPVQRMADRYAIWFTPATLVVCVAAWILSGDPLRVLAVLVVATPCPLLLATPVAILGGINRSARRQIIVRHGGALEALAAIDAIVFDKTGTLTLGHPEVAQVTSVPPFGQDEVLSVAASLERGSGHPLAQSVVAAHRRRELPAMAATGVREVPGRGVTGHVEGRQAIIGARTLVSELAPGATPGLAVLGADGNGLRAFVAIDGEAAGSIGFADHPRPDAVEALRLLRRGAVRRVLLLSGDDDATVRETAAALDIADARGELLPEDKVTVVRQLQAEGHRVLMVGDGTNDAPALAAADVGIALAGHGGGISAEAADVVLLADDLRRVPEATAIATRTLRIARQSLWAGLGLSAAAMVVAAFGYIPPTLGALLQEGIDVTVILNALRASLPPRGL